MGMEDIPFYKRLLDDLAKPRPDLAYKFKSAAQVAADKVQPGSPASSTSTPDAGNQDAAFNQDNVIPARPVNPFEVRVITDEGGAPLKIRCYKGIIVDYGTGKTGASTQAAIAVPKRTSKRVKINVGGGSAGIVGSDQRDFVPSNYDPGPEQFKYSEYNNPAQTTFIPTFTGVAYGGGSNAKPESDPEPETTTETFATGGYPFGKDTFNVNEQVGAYFEWPYSNGAMIRLFCKNASDPASRAWGVWGNSANPTAADLGQDGFFIYIAKISGTRVIQLFSSDIVAIGGGSDIHPFKVRRNGTVGDDIVYQIEPGTINNKEVGNISDTFILDDGELVWLQLTVGGAASNYEFPTSIAVQNGTVMPPDTDEHAYIKVAKRSGATIQQFITGSLWSDRIRLGSMTSKYYYARI
jgi:hypothetical protein